MPAPGDASLLQPAAAAAVAMAELLPATGWALPKARVVATSSCSRSRSNCHAHFRSVPDGLRQP